MTSCRIMYFNTLFILVYLFKTVNSKIIYPSTFVDKVEKLLSKTYGEREVNLFRQMIDESHENNANNWSDDDEQKLIKNITRLFGPNSLDRYLNIIKLSKTEYELKPEDLIVISSINLFKREFNKLKSQLDKHVMPQFYRFLQLKQHAQVINNKTDTTCWSPASCQAVESILNICSNIRHGADIAYDNFSVVIHVLGSVMAVLCGCLFVGPVQYCVLKNFPYTCKLPFPVFNSLLMANSMVWEVTKLTSVLCRVYGDPGLSNMLVRYDNDLKLSTS